MSHKIRIKQEICINQVNAEFYHKIVTFCLLFIQGWRRHCTNPVYDIFAHGGRRKYKYHNLYVLNFLSIIRKKLTKRWWPFIFPFWTYCHHFSVKSYEMWQRLANMVKLCRCWLKWLNYTKVGESCYKCWLKW